MLRYTQNIFKIKSTTLLLILSIFSLSLSALRYFFAKDIFLLFLIWNLFLAFIPWFFASIIYAGRPKHKIVIVVLILLWLLFFPNAPYILTDFIHLEKGKPKFFWYDFILILSYGFTGLLYTFVSLDFIKKIMLREFSVEVPFFVSALLLYISAFGIYLGRFLRWNSWDVFTKPNDVLADVASRVVNPFFYPETWWFTLLFGTLLSLMYWSYPIFSYDEFGKK
ncbi:DUF1361 domain-containing protein [Treponema phagedenis]|uniref:DUF1361 domain-containing protein n=1 Tax=Treponema phagedenis TaxID=162 RepID=UPI0001F63970|nr:DUF1361 domain-containing protein [Treponema phagedenis]EFW36406.1 hypothetical protein HMPREF9554_03104 [Treponema phagedenis F0421]TYT76636.1 DUF1361 domain-containing protein [Treponema phagedenis]